MSTVQPLASGIYVGSVRHRRFTPAVHAFSYRVFMMYLDLDEIDHVFDGVPLWSSRRAAPAWFRRADYFGDATRPLADCVRYACAAVLGDLPRGPIRMLTNLRYFGYCNNPVTFYYCFDASGERVECVLAEVTNTPWHERHHYVIRAGSELPEGIIKDRFEKVFHVSPFHPLDMEYHWRGTVPGTHLTVHMENFRKDTCVDSCVTDATLNLDRREITRVELLKILVQFPLMTAKVVLAIYWQALRLALKGVPFIGHPGGLRRVENPLREENK